MKNMNKSPTVLNVLVMVVLLAVLARIAWTLPFQLLIPRIYQEYLTFKSYIFWILMFWFHWGALKVVLIELSNPDKKASWFKKIVLVPFIPLLPVKNFRYKIYNDV